MGTAVRATNSTGAVGTATGIFPKHTRIMRTGRRFIVNRTAHWNGIYGSRESDTVSWFQIEPATSLELIDTAGVSGST
jgi:hypothetical protein